MYVPPWPIMGIVTMLPFLYIKHDREMFTSRDAQGEGGLERRTVSFLA
jgi:hypothetical protein